MQSRLVLASSVVLGLALGLLSEPAHGVNTTHPRTPVIWPDEVACAQTVNKGETPTLHFDYAVPVDDTEKGPDEPSDGRTHQFLAFSRQPETLPPRWISQADVSSALEAGALEAIDTPSDDEVLESSMAWPAETWRRITADDARAPITMAQASMGFDWDLSDVPVGTYVIGGYTWEPPINLWIMRPGFVRIVDGGAAPPGMRISSNEDLLAAEDAPATITGCLEAEGEATVDVAWKPAGGIGDAQWVQHESDVAVTSGSFAYDFTPDVAVFEALAHEPLEAMLLRFTLHDGNGNEYVAYTPTAVLVDIPSDSGTGTEGDDGDDTGCACDTSGGTPRVPWLLALPVLWWRRRPR